MSIEVCVSHSLNLVAKMIIITLEKQLTMSCILSLVKKLPRWKETANLKP